MLWNTVSLTNLRAIWDRPLGRFNYGLWLLWYWVILDGLATGREPHAFFLWPVVAYTAIVPWAVSRRMLCLGINRRWVLPYALLILGSAFVLASERWSLIALAVYAAVQAPLVFLPSRRGDGPRADAVV